MEKHTLTAKKRTTYGHKVKNLRKSGILPANVYGKKVPSLSIELLLKDFEKVFAKAGETGLIELAVDSKIRPVLVHNVAYHPVSSVPLHADFLQVDLKVKVTTKVPVETEGESPAVVNKIGVLLTLLSELEVEALPSDLPDKIVVDVSKLSAVDQTIKVSDVTISDKVKILTLVDTILVSVAPLVSKEAEKQAQEEEAAKAAALASAAASAESPAVSGGTAAPAVSTPAPDAKKEEPKTS